MLRAGLRRHRRRRRPGLHRGRPALAHDTDRPRSPRPRRCGRLVDRANLLIKIPATTEGLPAITATLGRRDQRQRHADLLPRPLPTRSWTPSSPAWSRPRPTATTCPDPLGRVVLRLPGRHRDRQAAGRDRHRRGERAQGKAGVANARLAYQALREVFAGDRWAALEAGRRQARSARCGPRPASRTPTTRHACTSTTWSRPTPSTRCRRRRCDAVADHGDITRRPRSPADYADAQKRDGRPGGARHRLRRRDRGRSRTRASRSSSPPGTSSWRPSKGQLERPRRDRARPSTRRPRPPGQARRARGRVRARPARLVRRRPRARRAPDPPAGDLTSTCPRTWSPTRLLARCSRAGRRGRPGRPPRGDAARRAHQRHRGPRGAAHRAAPPGGASRARGRRAGRRRPTCRPCSTKMYAFADKVRSRRVDRRHRRAGPDGRQHRHRRLRPRPGHGLRGAQAVRAGRPRVRFVSNIDPTDLAETVAGLDPTTTLFIVASKTFGTLETLTNARLGRAWLWDAAGHAPTTTSRAAPPSPSTSSPSPPRWTRSPRSASTPPTRSASGTGSAAATRSTPRSAPRWPSRSARTRSASSSPASTPSTSTSRPPRSRRTCPS